MYICIYLPALTSFYFFFFCRKRASLIGHRVDPRAWPLQDIVSRIGFCARINHPCIAPPPPTCTVNTITILLHDYCATYDAPRRPPLYAIHKIILALAISCIGQPRAQAG